MEATELPVSWLGTAKDPILPDDQDVSVGHGPGITSFYVDGDLMLRSDTLVVLDETVL